MFDRLVTLQAHGKDTGQAPGWKLDVERQVRGGKRVAKRREDAIDELLTRIAGDGGQRDVPPHDFAYPRRVRRAATRQRATKGRIEGDARKAGGHIGPVVDIL